MMVRIGIRRASLDPLDLTGAGGLEPLDQYAPKPVESGGIVRAPLPVEMGSGDAQGIATGT